jgi:RimJ/RimL family protein N-acetyltransferase
MSLMADPMIALISLQQAVTTGDPTVTPQSLGEDYVMFYDEPNGGKRFSYAKVVNREVQALSIFGLTDPIEGVPCFSVGYAVSERHRGQGLAVEAVRKGIKEMRMGFERTAIDKFYVEAVIDELNVHSIKTAELLFSCPGVATKDHYTKTPALYFKKLITIR